MDINNPEFWQERYSTNNTPWDTKTNTPALINSVNHSKSKKIAILGCGYSKDSLFLAKKGHKVYPIDFSKKSHIILASDGLWDVMDNETALRYIDTKNLKSSCKLLIRDSLKTSTDNITVLLANIN